MFYSSSKPYLFKLPVIRLLLLTALASLPAKAEIPPAIKSIGFSLSGDNLDQFDFNLPQQEIERQVSKNLSEWNFPVQAGTQSGYSHKLQVSIGIINHSQTPVGFSFSSGNSDPRSMEFQKADVLPVNCRITRENNPDDSHETQMSFPAGAIIEAQQTHAASSKIVTLLAEHISTTCFKLLDSLDIARPAPTVAGKTTIPTWMPSIRIETQEAVSPETPPKAEKSDEKSDAVTEPSVVIEHESSKQITIHNLGSPLILKFGHERR